MSTTGYRAKYVTVTSTLNAEGLLRIYIDGILHLLIDTQKLFEVQSWKMTTRAPPLFMFERTYKDGSSQRSEYDSIETWKLVLAEIDQAYGKVRNG